MKVAHLSPEPGCILRVQAEDGRCGLFDVSAYLGLEAFAALKDPLEFNKVRNGGYFVEWACGADLSVDTLEARWSLMATPTLN